MAKVTKLKVDIQNETTNTVYASWSFSKSHVDHYSVNWYYYTGDGIKFKGGSNDVTVKNDTYTPPENATSVYVSVKPVSTKYKKNKKEVSYWTGTRVGKTYRLKYAPPDKPSAPKLEIDYRTLTMSVENYEGTADSIQFYICEGRTHINTATAKLITKKAVHKMTVGINGTYKVRCRGVNIVGSKKIYGEWSEYSEEIGTVPYKPTYLEVTTISENSVKLKWQMTSTKNVDGYDIQYVPEKESNFKDPSKIGSQSLDTSSKTTYVSGLETGRKWFFRVRSKNEQGESDWCTVKSAILGTKPDAPTTWSLTNTVIAGEPITVYWVHNSEDNSIQQAAQVRFTVGDETQTITISTPSTDEDDKGKVYSLSKTPKEILATAITEGTEIIWTVRTQGALSTYGDWSTERKIKVYAEPTVAITLNGATDETNDILLESFPYPIVITPGPDTQKPVSYCIDITADETHETEDEYGDITTITEGTSVFRKIYNTSGSPLAFYLRPTDISLEDGQSYTVTATVAMNSGLTAEAEMSFEVNWAEDEYEPDASIVIDEQSLAAYISPYCEDENGNLISDVVLSVYRREYGGGFTLIEDDIRNNKYMTVTDPHPALNYARYRIVATSKTNGSIGYTDLPGEPVGEPSIVIQWDEKWSSYEQTDLVEDDEMDITPWSGSMVKLPYNIDVTENHANDVSLVNYIGREHPISYYGTQKGETATWTTTIVKSDTETLYALRRLATWTKDVYIREPSGTGYWAQISVSMNINHKELTIPVTFNISRVEGGI